MTSITAITALLRPSQWIKNVFVLLPLFFGGRFGDGAMLWHTLVGALMCCFAASSVYCINDLLDAPQDRQHPVKRRRPVASGAVSPAAAAITAAAAAAAAWAWGLLLPHSLRAGAWAITGAYWLLNMAYCLWLKRIQLVDVTVLALGFALRVLLGGEVSTIVPSPWLLIMTFLLALFLALAKRRDDVALTQETGAQLRRSTAAYSLTFMNLAITMVATITMMAYIMYTVSPEVQSRLGSRWIYITSVFVLVGILRYMQLTTVHGRSGSPTSTLLHDRFLQGCIVLWGATFAIILYA